jgi:hypothetical protein
MKKNLLPYSVLIALLMLSSCVSDNTTLMYQDGYNAGQLRGFNDGIQAEHDRAWDQGFIQGYAAYYEERHDNQFPGKWAVPGKDTADKLYRMGYLDGQLHYIDKILAQQPGYDTYIFSPDLP